MKSSPCEPNFPCARRHKVQISRHHRTSRVGCAHFCFHFQKNPKFPVLLRATLILHTSDCQIQASQQQCSGSKNEDHGSSQQPKHRQFPFFFFWSAGMRLLLLLLLLLLWLLHGSVVAVVSLAGLGGIVVAATITIAVAFRRFSVLSGACTDICHVAAYEQCVAHRAFLLPRCDALVVRVSGQLKPS